MAGQKSGRASNDLALAPMSLALKCHLPAKIGNTCMLGDMSTDPSPEDLQRLARLDDLASALKGFENIVAQCEKERKALVIDLVQREILSQARAAKLAGLSRQTVMKWVNTWPGEI